MTVKPDFSKIRLICSDIDGTLLNGGKAIAQPVKDELRRLQSQGIVFAFATGRLPYEVEPLLEGLLEKVPYVAGNGAVIKCGEEGLREYDFIPERLRGLAEKYSALGVTVVFSYNDQERPLKVTPWARSAASAFPGMDNPADGDIWNRRIRRMFFCHPQGAYLKECRKNLDGYSDDYDICVQNDRSIQIAPLGCTKAAGVGQLAQMLGIEREAVLCVGDGENDISMIQYAGIGAAVANGTDALKRASDYVTKEPCAMGVLEVLKLCGKTE